MLNRKVTIDRLEFILNHLNKNIKPIFYEDYLTVVGSIEYEVISNIRNINEITKKYYKLKKKYEK